MQDFMGLLIKKRDSNKLLTISLICFCIFLRIMQSQTVVCPLGTYYYEAKCFTDCNISTIQDQSNNTIGLNLTQLYYLTQGTAFCTPYCSSECLTCDTYSDICLSCHQQTSSNFLLFSKCYSKCPQLYFQNYTAFVCDSCSNLGIGCSNCSINKNCSINGGLYNCTQKDTKTCLTCDSLYFMFYQIGTNFSQCISKVPDGYINILGVATKCNNQCLTCQSFVWNCTYCSVLIYHNSQCLTGCPLSHYNNTVNVSFNSVTIETLMCELCVPPCLTCLSENQCLSCVINLYFSPTTFSCVNQNACPITTYANNTNYECQKCVNPCRRCANYHQCQQCLSGYLYQSGCVDQCPKFTYISTLIDSLSQNNFTLVCNLCASPCSQCLNSSACLNCVASTNIYYFQANLSCLYGCPNQYWQKKLTMTCETCPQYCQTCNQTQCFSCIQINNTDVYYLQNGQCLTSCMPSYYPSFTISLICLSCPNECVICQNSTYCSQCIVDYFLIVSANFSKICSSMCSGPYFVQADNSFGQLVCDLCSDYLCLECTAQDYCISCVTQYNVSGQPYYDSIALFQGKCYLNCVSPYQKVKDSVTLNWTCQIPSTYVNQTYITLEKGVIITFFTIFLGSYISAGLTLFAVIIFIFIRYNQEQKGKFFAILSAFIALPELYVIVVMGYTHFMYHIYQFVERYKYSPLSIILFGCFVCHLILNFVNIYLFSKVCSLDKSYQQWKKHNSIGSSALLVFIHTLSLFNYKFQNILWSKFGFFPVLQQVSKLNYYNAICGIGMFPTLGIVICCGFSYISEIQVKDIYLDAIVVITFEALLIFISLKRSKDLFIFNLKQGSDQSFSNSKRQLHRRIVQSDEVIGTAIKPSGIQINDEYLNKNIKEDLNTELLSSNSSKYFSSNSIESSRKLLTLSSRKMDKSSLSNEDSQIIFYANNNQDQDAEFNQIQHGKIQILSFQNISSTYNLNNSKLQIQKQRQNIQKSEVNKKELGNFKCEQISKCKSVQLNKNQISFSEENQTINQLNDAISSIEQGTNRGDQGSFQESQQQQQKKKNYQVNQKKINLSTHLKTEQNQQKNYKIQKQTGLKVETSFAHNQKQMHSVEWQSFQQIKVLDLMDSFCENISNKDNMSDQAVFQQSMNGALNEQDTETIQQVDIDRKNQLQNEEKTQKQLIMLVQSERSVKKQQISKSQSSKTQNNQQYFGGYSIDNSMGSIHKSNLSENKIFQSNFSQKLESQQKQNIIKSNEFVLNNSQVCQIQADSLSYHLKNSLIKKQQVKNSIKLQKTNQKEAINQNVKQSIVRKQANQYMKLFDQSVVAQHLYQANSQHQINKSWQNNSLQQQNDSNSQNNSQVEQSAHQKTFQVSSDKFEEEQDNCQSQFDILPLVLNQSRSPKNQNLQNQEPKQPSQLSIIYQTSENQIKEEEQLRNIKYIYNDFTSIEKQKSNHLHNIGDTDQTVFKEDNIEEFQTKKQYYQGQHKPQHFYIGQEVQQQIKDKEQVKNQNEYMQFRIKTTLKSNQKKHQRNSIAKKNEVLLIEDKKFKKLKKQLKLLQKQQNKQKAIIQNIDNLTLDKKIITKNNAKPIVQRQKDIQKIYTNEWGSVNKKQKIQKSQRYQLTKSSMIPEK